MHLFDPSSLIFPKIQPGPTPQPFPNAQAFSNAHPFSEAQASSELWNTPLQKQDILNRLHSTPETDILFHSLSPQAQQAFLEFCMGNRGLKVTFDPFFQHIFHPERHPERLNRLLSCILGQEVTVERALPREHSRLSEKGSLIIMDILVRLTDGSLVNVEMQRIGYDFPGERGSCYGADLLIRQYDLIRQTQGKNFSYRDMKPVYVIVFLEKSTSIFHEYPDKFLHRSALSFDTGLKMPVLQNFIYIPLDIFRKMEHNELTELEAWMYFLSSDKPSDILRITEKYPFFQELYQDIAHFRYHPKELITMFSDALRIMDENTVMYMVDELKAELAQQRAEFAQQKAVLHQKETAFAKQQAELTAQKAEFQRQKLEIDNLRAQLAKYQGQEPQQ